jgi:hypothetical protein
MKAKLNSKSVWSAILKAVAGVLALVISTLDGNVSLQDAIVSGVPIVWGAIDYMIRLNTSESIK